MTDAIRTEGLTKSYGEARGVFALDLQVLEGEIFGFLGPNGSGKTTTIRLLLDLIRPDSGRASVFGHDCRREATEVHRLTGYLPGGAHIRFHIQGDMQEAIAALARFGPKDLISREPSLTEVFVGLYEGDEEP